MFRHILTFELQYRFKKISTCIYFALFAFIGFMTIWRGSYGEGLLPKLVFAGIGEIKTNAPFALYYLITIISNYAFFLIAGYFASAAAREFKYDTYSLYFSYPVKKIDYLSGRFAAAFISCLFVLAGITFGAFIASVSPLVIPGKMDPVNMIVYLQPYLIGVMPNILIIGSISFSISLLTRKFFPVYTGIVAFVIFYLIGSNLYYSMDNVFLPSLIDPFGHIAAHSITDYWTIAQKNSFLLTYDGNYLWNRMLWLTVAVLILFAAYRKFNFSHLIETGKSKLRPVTDKEPTTASTVKHSIFSYQPQFIFSFKSQFKLMLNTLVYEFKGLVYNKYFLAILLLGFSLLFVLGFKNVGLAFDTQTFPVTSQILAATESSLYILNLIIVLFCSAEIVWRERSNKTNEIFDSLPNPIWISFLGKLGAIMTIQFFMIIITMIGCIIIQILHGYYLFEPSLYFKELFGMRLSYYLLISVFAMSSQVVVNKKLLGYIITFFFVDDLLPIFGFQHHLYRFASAPDYIYSDMNGYGPYLKSIFFYKLYWIPLAVFLLVIAMLFWVRGTDNRWKLRLKTLRLRISNPVLITGGLSLFLCLVFGSIILYNTTILNRYESKTTMEEFFVGYEKQFKRYYEKPQPQIIDIKMNVDLYPKKRSYHSYGSLKLKNETGSEIKELFIQVPDRVKTKKLVIDIPFTLKETYNKFGVHILELPQAMLAGSEIILQFDIELNEQGFKNNHFNIKLLENGTSLRQTDLIPRLGYNPNHELKDNDKRKKYGLNPHLGIPSIDSQKARMFMDKRRDAGWITYEAMVSTSFDQTALTAGELINDWIEGDRHYFHYKCTEKMNLSFPLLSGKYLVEKDQWQDVKIEVYYHKNHDYNIGRMIESLKRSLDYFTKIFSSYQYKIIRIVEFPRYARFAESLPTIIPFSEAYGFIMRTDNEDNVFRITAHELGHQWWGHQVRGAYVQGTEMLSETMAQYASLVALQSTYDKEMIREFTKFELKRYLKGRANEYEKEVPLMLVENQAYIFYGKGFVVMNALQDYLGEDKLNGVIKKYVQKVSFQSPPFTTSIELLNLIKEVTPDSLQYVLKDMFESIILYQNKITEAKYRKLDNGKFLIKIKFYAEKLKADELGEEIPVEFCDYITFGIFGIDGKELYLKKHWIKSGIKEMELIVDEIPVKAGIDPYYYLIDKNINDNLIMVEKD